MKKQVVAAALGLSMFAMPAFAHGNESKGAESGKGLKLGIFKNLGKQFTSNDTQFVVMGNVQTVTTGSFTVKVKASANVANITNGIATVKTDANTKFSNPVAVGQNVVATGSLSSTDLLAAKVQVLGAEPVATKPASQKAVGKVTAKTDTSVTITNTLTNTTQTVTTDANTKVKIDGEVKTVADINVGDSGWIRFKTVGTTLVAKVIHLFR